VTAHPAIARAARAFQRRDYPTVERECASVLARDRNNSDALHLYGLALRGRGATQQALQYMERSLRLEPNRAEFYLNYSNLLRSLGRLRDAELALRQALNLEPDSRQARLTLARLLTDASMPSAAIDEARPLLERDADDAEALAITAAAQSSLDHLDEAATSFRKAIRIKPEYAIARHNYAALLCKQGRAEEALQELDAAERLGVGGPEFLYNKGSALMMLSRFDDADSALVQALELAPEDVSTHELLAKLRFMRGEQDFTRSFEGLNKPNLISLRGDLLRRAGCIDHALSLIQDLYERYPDSPSLATSLAVLLQEHGQLEEALVHARHAARASPDNTAANENLIAILLQLGRPDETTEYLAHIRRVQPLDQRWLTYEATAARLKGEPRYEELFDYERFVLGFDLEPPAGYATIEAFHEELVPILYERHGFEMHPLDQSLRFGSQTPRSLLSDPNPVVGALIEALRKSIEVYRQAVGFDAAHPFLERNRGKSHIVGCWSVKLRSGGFHVNHIHPEGWLSSAYYVEVPKNVSASNSKSGWIKFGEPRMPTLGAGPAHYERPREGRLVLFPSYMWHGTVPFEADEPRMTVAFDVRPD
jgi:tetratricopeptide (TPR) repeat protein